MNWEAYAARLIAEDAPSGDLTTETLGLSGRAGRIAFAARAPMTVAGVELAAAILRQAGVGPRAHCRSGDEIAAGALLLEGEGDAAGLHVAWKAAQTMMECLSGVASSARAIVRAVESVDPRVRVACTRKTFPGGRDLSQFAAKAGGAILHRAGLSETVLVFAEHRAFLDAEDWPGLAARLGERAPEKRLGVEVSSVAEAKAAIAAGFDTIQLEKFPLEAVAEVAAHARRLGSRALIAAAGGVNASNAAAYVRAGARLIVTSAPYAAPPRDVSVTVAAINRT